MLESSVCTLCTVSIVALGLFLLYKIFDRLIRIPCVGRYSDRYVVLTGASRGLGYEALRRLDSLGFHVFAGVRTKEAADKLRADCSTRVDPVIIDLNKLETVQEAFKYVTSKLPQGRGLWGLISNAAHVCPGSIEWLQLNDYKEHFEANIFGTVQVTLTFLPLVKKERGRVVNVGSIGGRVTLRGAVPYCMTKYALEAYSDGLRRSMKPYGVKVSIIEPGVFLTEPVMNGSALILQAWERTPVEIKDELGQKSLDKFLNDSKLGLANASNRLQDVVDAYLHALVGKYPRARYVVGLDAKYMFLPMSYLPEWLFDLFWEKLSQIKMD